MTNYGNGGLRRLPVARRLDDRIQDAGHDAGQYKMQPPVISGFWRMSGYFIAVSLLFGVWLCIFVPIQAAWRATFNDVSGGYLREMAHAALGAQYDVRLLCDVSANPVFAVSSHRPKHLRYSARDLQLAQRHYGDWRDSTYLCGVEHVETVAARVWGFNKISTRYRCPLNIRDRVVAVSDLTIDRAVVRAESANPNCKASFAVRNCGGRNDRRRYFNKEFLCWKESKALPIEYELPGHLKQAVQSLRR